MKITYELSHSWMGLTWRKGFMEIWYDSMREMGCVHDVSMMWRMSVGLHTTHGEGGDFNHFFHYQLRSGVFLFLGHYIHFHCFLWFNSPGENHLVQQMKTRERSSLRGYKSMCLKSNVLHFKMRINTSTFRSYVHVLILNLCVDVWSLTDTNLYHSFSDWSCLCVCLCICFKYFICFRWGKT